MGVFSETFIHIVIEIILFHISTFFRQPAMGWAQLHDLEDHDLHHDGEGPGHDKDHIGGGGREGQTIKKR